MEKEFQIEYSNLELNYVGAEFDQVTESLTLLANVFSTFLTGDLNQTASLITVSITLCSSEKIIELNSQYRNKNKETDVLSFPVQENIRGGEVDNFSPELELGDIYICEDVCLKQAREFKLEFREEFIHLAVHGFLHLCGFDHEISSSEEELMEELEKKLITRITQIK